MWFLQLNDMRSPKVERLSLVAYSEHRDALLKFLDDQMSEPYVDGHWRKVYRQGGPLEWFNPPFDLVESVVDAGTEEDFAERGREHYRNFLSACVLGRIE